MVEAVDFLDFQMAEAGEVSQEEEDSQVVA